MESPMTPLASSSTDEPVIDKPGWAPLPRWTLWAAGYAILLCALYLAWDYNFVDHSSELVDLGKIAGYGVAGFLMWLLVTTLMFGGWVAAIIALRGRSLSDVWIPVAGLTLMIYVAFMMVYPATAIDVYIYAARSHLLTGYGLNPSTVAPSRFWDIDPFVHFASREWSTEVSPYGPLWNLVAAPATAFDGDNIRTSILLFKGITVAAIVAIGVLIHEITRIHRPAFAVAAAVTWLWCPVVLWEGIANSHNDVILLLPVLAALWCWHRGYLGWVVPLIVVSALIKIVTLMILPVAVAAIVSAVGFNRRLLQVAWQSALLSLAAAWVAFAPFYDIQGVVDAVQSQRGIWVTSPALLLDRISKSQGWGLDVRSWYEEFSMVLIIVITMVGTVVAWKRPGLLPRIGFEQFFWFLLLATTNLRPWYGLWLIAVVAILPLGFTWLRAGAWIVAAQFSYALGAWVRHWFDMSSLEHDSLNFAISLGPVLLVIAWWALHSVTSRKHDRDLEMSTSHVEPSSG